jgi:hypothetical protein
VQFVPGDGTAVIASRMALLIDQPMQPDVAELFAVATSFDEVVDHLSARGIRSLPSLACVSEEGGRVRVLVRGTAVVHLSSRYGGEMALDARGAATWAEHVIDDVAGATLELVEGVGASHVGHRVSSGIVPACRVTIGVAVERAAPEAHTPVERKPVAASATDAPETDGLIGPIVSAIPAPDVPADVAADQGPAAPADEPPAAADVEVPVDELRDDAADEAPEETDDEHPDREDAVEIAPPTASDFDYRHLLDESVYLSVEDAAVREAGSRDGASADEPSASAAGLAPDAESERRDDATKSFVEADVDADVDADADAEPDLERGLGEGTTGQPSFRATPPRVVSPSHRPAIVPQVHMPDARPGGRLIDGAPGLPPHPSGGPDGPPLPPWSAVEGSAAPGSNGPSAATTGPHEHVVDDPTISADAVARARRDAESERRGPLVQAIECPSQHANPPNALRCRVCGEEISDLAPRTLPRPTLGLLRFEDGTLVSLSGPVLIGRKPSSAGVDTGAEQPQLVALPDPDKLLSRTHLEVRIIDWQVQVVDKDSTNLSFVTIPGKPRHQLIAGEAFPISPGTVVDLGDATRFTYEVGG